MSLADKLVADVRKEFGENSAHLAKDIPRRGGISSGSMALDYAIGPMFGLPRDRVMEFFGPESSGKSTLGLLAIANSLDTQPKRGALILDLEGKMMADRIEDLLGSERMKRTVVLYPDHIEQAHDMYMSLVPSGDIAFAMIDSIGGAPTKRATEESAENPGFGAAKAITAFARQSGIYANKYTCATLGINQLRENLRPNDHSLVTPGGKGWKHHCALRVYLRKGKGRMSMQMGNDTVDVGYTVAGRVVKNHVGGIEGREFSYWFYNAAYQDKAIGVDQAEEIERLATATGVVERSGGWYKHPGLPKGQVNGKPAFTAALTADAALRKTLAEATMAALRTVEDVDLTGPDPEKVGDVPDV